MVSIDTRIVEIAIELDGLHAGEPSHLPVWHDLLGLPPPNGGWDLAVPFRVWKQGGRWRTQGLSTCGLVADGILRQAGVAIPELHAPYRWGRAITRVVEAAREQGAWQVPSEPPIAPYPGDYVVIGSGIQTHALICLSCVSGELEPDAVVDLPSIDGGQVHPTTGLQLVSRRVRQLCWRRRAGQWTLTLGERPVVGWADSALWRLS